MPLKQTIIAAAIMLVAAACLPYLKNTQDQPLKKVFAEFPQRINSWQGTTDRFEDSVYKMLGVDDSILVDYIDREGGYIQLYVGYYASQREGETIHSPMNCMPGNGWNIVQTALVPLDLKDQNGNPVRVVKLVLEKGIQRQLMFYWYHSRGRVITSEYARKIYLLIDAVTRNRTDGSFVRLITPLEDPRELQAAETLKHFAEQIFPILNEFIPS